MVCARNRHPQGPVVLFNASFARTGTGMNGHRPQLRRQRLAKDRDRTRFPVMTFRLKVPNILLLFMAEPLFALCSLHVAHSDITKRVLL